MRRFPFDRLHHSARRQSRRHIQQQMHMIGSHMPLHDLDIQRSANLSRQIPHLFPDLSSQSRLAVLGDEHKVISQPIHCMRTFPILRHLRSVPPSLLKASPKGEGVHPSQSGTLSWKGHGHVRSSGLNPGCQCLFDTSAKPDTPVSWGASAMGGEAVLRTNRNSRLARAVSRSQRHRGRTSYGLLEKKLYKNGGARWLSFIMRAESREPPLS